MRAAYFEEHGGPEVLQVGELADPELGPRDVRVAVKACALNRLDLFVREGWPGLRLPLPHIGGTDVAGTVLDVGSEVEGVTVGDDVVVNPGLNFDADEDGEQVIPAEPSVLGETRWGGLAEQCVVPATHVLPKPQMDWVEAAALPLTLQTCMQMCRRGGVAEGTRVLVVGGGGGVSVTLIQMAKALGAWVVATTGGPDKVERVSALGADVVIDYHEDDWSKQAFLATEKRGFDVVFDSVGTATWPFSVRALAPGGRLVTCGATTGGKVEMDVRSVFWKQLRIIGSTMGTPADLTAGLELVGDGKIKAFVDSVFPLDDAREAHERLASGDVFGKVVVTP